MSFLALNTPGYMTYKHRSVALNKLLSLIGATCLSDDLFPQPVTICKQIATHAHTEHKNSLLCIKAVTQKNPKKTCRRNLQGHLQGQCYAAHADGRYDDDFYDNHNY